MSTKSCISPVPADQPFAVALHEAPIRALASHHQRTLAQCMALRALAQYLLDHRNDASAQSTARDILDYFDTSARISRADEERDLFPALIESMAGSDAVCLRGMTQSLSDMLGALEQRWRSRLRPCVLRVAQGEPGELPRAELEAFSSEYAHYIERCDTELLPMAERLLSNAELESLEQAMRARRAGIISDPNIRL